MISPLHLHTQARVQPSNTYIHTYIKFVLDKYNNVTQSPDKTTCTPDPAKYKSNLDLKINNTALLMATHSKVLGQKLDPKLTYSTYIHNISVHVHRPLQIHLAIRGINKLFAHLHHTSVTLKRYFPPQSSHPCPTQKKITLSQIILTQSPAGGPRAGGSDSPTSKDHGNG